MIPIPIIHRGPRGAADLYHNTIIQSLCCVLFKLSRIYAAKTQVRAHTQYKQQRAALIEVDNGGCIMFIRGIICIRFE